MKDARTEWLDERKFVIGASETPSILGCGFETPAEVWARKTGHETPRSEGEHLEIGNVIQPALIELARRRLHLDVIAEPDFVFRRSEAVPYVGASLDAYIVGEDGKHCPLDTKNVDGMNARDWANEPPLNYTVQLQQQMFVTGASYGYLFALIGGNKTAWHRIERNDAFITAMLKKLEHFWRLVQTKTPPPYQDAKDQARILSILHPQDSGAVVALDEIGMNAVDRREVYSLQLDEIEAKKLEAENEIKAMLGDATYAVLPDGRAVSWKTQNRKEHFVKASTSRVLRFHDRLPKGVAAITNEVEPLQIEANPT